MIRHFSKPIKGRKYEIDITIFIWSPDSYCEIIIKQKLIFTEILISSRNLAVPSCMLQIILKTFNWSSVKYSFILYLYIIR